MNIRTIAAVIIAFLPLTAAGCAADTGEEEVPGDPGESTEEAAEGSTSCSADDMTTPECVQMMNAIQTAMNDALGPDDGTSQTSDEEDLHFDNTGTGSGSGSGSGGSGSGSGSGSSGKGGSSGGSGSGSAGSGGSSSGDQSAADPKSGSTGGITSRRDMLARAQQWVKDHVMYSQSKYHNGYRQDCSGFVSMAWGISKNLNTSSYAPYSKSVSHQLSDYNQLQPGDALNKSPRGHMFMFAGWANSAHSSMYIYEESHTGAPALYKSVPKSYFSHFVPIRKNGM